MNGPLLLVSILFTQLVQYGIIVKMLSIREEL
jgi:hypothetical protein